MRDGGRLAAAIEVLDDIETRHRPARLALKTWGERSRFAGSKDRAFVSGLVLDVLRKRRSLAWRMGADSNRAAAIAALKFEWGWTSQAIAEACADEEHGPGALSTAEAAALETPADLAAAPDPVRGDYPDWLDEDLGRAFGDRRVAEAQALAQRAPVDLRVNLLKTDPVRALKALAPLGPETVDLLEGAIRMPAPDPSRRAGAVETIPAFSKGW
ncbi:MAG: MFS transporter, partial [Phenylobacterium sp.]|nr:MFS transporter [Phenylobacterium sp.]